MTNSPGNCGFGHFTAEIPNGKLNFLCSVALVINLHLVLSLGSSFLNRFLICDMNVYPYFNCTVYYPQIFDFLVFLRFPSLIILLAELSEYLFISIKVCINSFYVTSFFLYHLKTLENQRFFEVFRRYLKKPVTWNRLDARFLFIKCFSRTRNLVWKCFFLV